MILLKASFVCLVYCLVHLTSADNCNIGLYTRKACVFGQVITDEASCLALGCCYDPSGPTFGKCYKKGSAVTFGGFSFSATVPPSLKNIPGVIEIGGEEGFPGSEIRLECNPFRKCAVNYGKQLRSECIRQGCCFKNGQCYQNTIKIMKLRDKCPPGFSDPPACAVVDPCEKDKPCRNGGVCTFTGPGKFSCACKVGFSGETCAPNCKLPYIYGASAVPGASATGDYPVDATIVILCNGGHQMQTGAVTSRKCVEGNFQPLISLSPITCSQDCAVESQSGVSPDAKGATVSHKTAVTYSCDSGVSDKDNQLTRTCLNGTLSPTLLSTPIVCHQDCSVQVPTGASASVSTATVQYGKTFTLSCSNGYTGDGGNKALHQCGLNGVITPVQSDFKCYPHCTAAQPADTAYVLVGGGAQSVDHRYPYGTKLLYSCVTAHTHQAGATVETTCGKDGQFAAVNPVCSQECSLSTMSDYIHNQGAKTSVNHGVSVEFSCKQGYSNPATKVTYVCNDSGFVIDSQFVCHKDCDRPSNDPHLTFSSEVTSAKMLSGTSFTISCQPPYTPETASTDLSRSCVDGSVEPADLVVCRAACSPTTIETAIVTSTIFKHDDPIVYQCLPGHVQSPESNMQRTCKNGVTSPDPTSGNDKVVCYKPCSFTAPDNTIVDSSNTATVLTTGSVYKHGTTFTLTCAATHTAVTGTTFKYECRDGVLDAAVDFSCTLDCTPPAVSGVSFTTLTKYSQGLSVNAQCDSDQVLTGTVKRTCGAGGQFTPALNSGDDQPKCNNPCTATSRPANTNYVVDGGKAKTADHKYLHGTKLTYSCLPTFTHKSGQVAESTCSDGTFSPTTIDCKADCDLAAFIKDKHYAHDQGNAITVHSGTAVKIRCDTGFSNPDHAQVTRTCDNSVFKPVESFMCYQDCAAPKTVEHGAFTPGTAIKHGQSQDFKCDNGYMDEGTVDKTPTCNDGQYLFDPAGTLKCNKDCTPETLANGDYTTDGETTKKATYHHGEKIRYECNNKHSDNVDEAALVRTCQFGHFSPKFKDDLKPIICLPDCDVPVRTATQILYRGQVNNALALLPETHQIEYQCTTADHALAVDVEAERTCVQGSLAPKMSGATDIVCRPTCAEVKLFSQEIDSSHLSLTSGRYRSGTVLTYSCSAGYVMPRGLDTKTKCGTDGTYTVDPSNFGCMKTCADPETPKDGKVAGHTLTTPYRDGDRLTYECNDKFGHGHVTDATLTVTCLNTGLFSPSLADSKVECKKDCTIIDIGNVAITSTTLIHTATYSYTCAPGYSMVPGAHNQYQCLDGTLDYLNKPTSNFIAPKCHLKCTIPSGLDDVIFTVSTTTVQPGDQVDHRANIVLSCPASHTAVGDPYRTCDNSNIVRELSGVGLFSCFPKCTTPDMTLRGGTFKDIPNKGLIDHGHVAVLDCSNGFYNPVTTYLCTKGSFDANVKCYRDCKPDDIGNLKTAPVPIRHGSIFSYVCDDDHSMNLNANNNLLCHDGNLVDATTKAAPVVAPSCHKICKPEDFPNILGATPPNGPINHGLTGTYTCYLSNHAPKLGQKATRTCMDGNLDPPVLADNLGCYQKCPVPDYTIKIGTPDKQDFVVSGDTLSIICPSKTHDGFGEMPRTCGEAGDFTKNFNDHQFNCFERCSIKAVDQATHDKDNSATTFKHQESITHTCNDNFSFEDKKSFTTTCSDGAYVAEPGVCYKMCDVTSEPNQRTKSPNQAQYRFKQTFDFGCISGWSSADTQVTRKCGANGVLDYTLDQHPFTCYKDCTVPATVTNGKIKVATIKTVKNGHTAEYECNSNADAQEGTDLFPSGSLLAPCLEGTLNIDNVICKKKCRVPTVPNAKLWGEEPFNTGDYVPHETTASYSCNRDYTLQRFNTASCNDGVIDVTPIKCFKKCKLTEKTAEKFLELVNKLVLTVIHGQSVEYKCFDGFAFEDGQSTKSATCDNGETDISAFVCKQNCQVKELENATPLSPYAVAHNTAFDYLCNVGYDKSFGSTNVAKRVCLNGVLDKTLEDYPFACYAKCQIPAPNSNVNLPNNVMEGSYILHEQEVTYSCSVDHHTTAVLTVKCNAGVIVGLDDINCTPDCVVPAVTGATPTKTVNSKVQVGQEIGYTCNSATHDPGDHVVEPQKVLCKADGTIDTSDVKCYQKCNTANLNPKGAQKSSSTPASVKHNQPVNFECTGTYSFLENNADATYYSVLCNDGQVDVSTQKCHPPCPLPSLSQLAHVTDPKIQSLKYGRSVTYTCDGAGMNPSNTNKMTRVCQTDGNLDFPFDSYGITCVEECTIPTSSKLPSNIKVIPTSPKINHGQEITVTCNEGYRSTASGLEEQKIACKSGSLGTVQDPVCEQQCKVPDNSAGLMFLIDPKTNQEISVNSYVNEAEVFPISCDTGYALSSTSPTSAYCSSGKMRVQGKTMSQCVRTCEVQDLTAFNAFTYSSSDQLMNVGTTVNLNTAVKVNCRPSYSRTSSNVYSCNNDGVIRDGSGRTYPVCKAPCPNSLISGNQPSRTILIPVVTGVTAHLGKVSMECESGYYTSTGNAAFDITCTNGQFDILGTSRKTPTEMCFPKCESDAVRNGGAITNFDQVNSYYKDNTLTVTCPSKMNMGFNKALKSSCLSSGSFEEVTCYQQCQYQTKLSNTKAPAIGDFDHNEQVTFECSTGYALADENAGTVTCKDGSLDTAATVCKRKCNAGVDFPESAGFIDFSQNIYVQDEYLTLACKKGHTLQTTKSRRQCLGTGLFDLTVSASCNQDCPFSLKTPRSRAEYFKEGTTTQLTSAQSIAYKEAIIVQCPTGTTPFSSTSAPIEVNDMVTKLVCGGTDGTLTDVPTGSWANFKICRNQCTGVSSTLNNGKVLTIHSGTINHGESITYECDADHNADTSLTKTCSDGVLTPPVCYSKCSLPAQPDNTKPYGITGLLDHGGSLKVECADGYVMTPESVNTVTCSNGSPLTFSVTCELKCTEAPEIINGALSTKWPGHVDLGTSLGIKCDKDTFPPYNVKAKVTCNNQGSFEPFSCYKTCTTEYTNTNIPTSTKLYHNQPFNLECAIDTDPHPSNGQSKRVCLNENITPNTQFTCMKRCTAPEGATVTKDKTVVNSGETVTYTCKGALITSMPLVYTCSDGDLKDTRNYKITTAPVCS